MNSRHLIFLAGLLCLALLWLGPLPRMAAHSFSAHMALHMGLVAVAAALLALGIAGSPWDPVRLAPRLFPPVPLAILELIVVWAWHLPVPHLAARHSMVGLLAEQGSFLIAGLLVWISAFGGDPTERSSGRTGAGVASLLLTSMHMTLLGALLALAPRPLYRHGHHAHDALSPLDDQHLGGAIMLIIGGISYLAGGLWLTARLISSPDKLKPEMEAGA